MAAKGDKGAGDPARGMDLLWGTVGRPSRGPKPSMSVDRITGTAVEIADAEGLAAVSMQRIAAAFGFTTMSLYRYVPGKAELVALMIDTAIGDRPDLGGVPGGWRDRLAEWARRCLRLYVRHPWLLAATGGNRVMGPNELGWLDAALAVLADAGFTPVEQHDAFLLVNGHVRSVAQYTTGADRLRVDEWSADLGERLRRHGDRFPALVAAIEGGGYSQTTDEPLEFGLRCLLDGLDRLLTGRASPG
ncbi:TetR/AcrR family transcriptional regulator [Microbispora amethystogenes]|uniref:TetR family transcriptional regulator n=1 Tax=Microbispora amethystogenes TaxID=1427754 RepID=A0ABQ4FMR9_9ACTN|nr:TetR/AcrR family transcriptional regulator [Microbispora amethystogenes]GIH36048.1 TetR family transcriptional regulator [Microbispora amethystogenes]